MSKNPVDQNSLSRRDVSVARLRQRCGPQHALGGWEKVRNKDGTFWMREKSR